MKTKPQQYYTKEELFKKLSSIMTFRKGRRFDEAGKRCEEIQSDACYEKGYFDGILAAVTLFCDPAKITSVEMLVGAMDLAKPYFDHNSEIRERIEERIKEWGHDEYTNIQVDIVEGVYTFIDIEKDPKDMIGRVDSWITKDGEHHIKIGLPQLSCDYEDYED